MVTEGDHTSSSQQTKKYNNKDLNHHDDVVKFGSENFDISQLPVMIENRKRQEQLQGTQKKLHTFRQIQMIMAGI